MHGERQFLLHCIALRIALIRTSLPAAVAVAVAAARSSRFSASEGVSGSSLAKSSVARNIKKSIVESYPVLDGDDEQDGHLDRILGDKKQVSDAAAAAAAGCSRLPSVRELRSGCGHLAPQLADRGHICIVARCRRMCCCSLCT